MSIKRVICADKLIMGKHNIEHITEGQNFKFYEVELTDQEIDDIRIFGLVRKYKK